MNADKRCYSHQCALKCGLPLLAIKGCTSPEPSTLQWHLRSSAWICGSFNPGSAITRVEGEIRRVNRRNQKAIVERAHELKVAHPELADLSSITKLRGSCVPNLAETTH